MATLKQCQFDFKKAKKKLVKYQLQMPGSLSKTYGDAFYSVHSPIALYKPHTKILYGRLRTCIQCDNGYLLAFQVPTKDKGKSWKPILVSLELVTLDTDEIRQAAALFNAAYLQKHPFLFTFGHLEEYKDFYAIRLRYLRWTYLSPPLNVTRAHVKYFLGYTDCHQVLPKLATKLQQDYVRRFQSNWAAETQTNREYQADIETPMIKHHEPEAQAAHTPNQCQVNKEEAKSEHSQRPEIAETSKLTQRASLIQTFKNFFASLLNK